MWSTLEQPRAGASVLPTTHAPTTSAPITAPWSPPAFEQPTSPARANPTAVLAIVWIGAAATVALWWFNTTSISGFGDWLTNAGRITGLLAGYSVVVLVALMARLPPLERGVGSDRLARWHSMGGRYTVCLIVAHALLITWGYAVVAHTNVMHQEWTLLRSYPDVLMATVAGLLFVGVGISSMRAARRKLRYETWYYLHLYTYLAIALAFAHQFASGAEFMSSLSARIAWASLYASVGVAADLVSDRRPGRPGIPSSATRAVSRPRDRRTPFRSSFTARTSTNCRLNPVSSSAFVSCPGTCGGRSTPIRCRRR